MSDQQRTAGAVDLFRDFAGLSAEEQTMDELRWRVRDAICRRDNDCGDEAEIAKIMCDLGDYYEALARAAIEEMQRTDAPPVDPAVLA